MKGQDAIEKESLLGDMASGPPLPQTKQGNPFLWSMRILFLVAGLALFDLTIIIPTSVTYFSKLLFPNIPDDQLTVKEEKQANLYFSLSLSFFSIAQAVVGVFGGYMLRVLRFKKTFVLLLMCTVIGDCMYAIGVNYIVAIVGRTLAGVGSANLGMVFTYCAVVTSNSVERNHYMSLARLASAVGLVFSPGTVFIFGYINIKISKNYTIDQLNSCGWLVALLAILCIILVIAFVKNPGPPPPRPETERLMVNTNEPPPKKPSIYMSKEVLIVFIFSFYNGFTGTSFEFISAPITQAKFNMEASTLSLYMLGGSFLTILVIIAVIKLTPKWGVVIRTGERFWMMFAFIVFIFGIAGCYISSTKYIDIKPMRLGEAIFMISQAVSMSSYIMLSVSLLPLASKIVPPYAKEMMMPWVNSCLAIGRLTGPLWSNFTYSVQDNRSTEFMFGSIFAILFLCISLLLIFWKRMVADVWKENSSLKNFA